MEDVKTWLRIFAYIPLCFSLCLALGIDRIRSLELTLMPLVIALLVFGAACLWRSGQRLIWSLYGAWCFIWMIGLLAEAYILQRYKLELHSREVVEAILNTSPKESLEYVSTASIPALIGVAFSIVTAVAMANNGKVVSSVLLSRLDGSVVRAALGIVLVTATIAAHGNIVVERSNALAFMPWLYRQGTMVEFTPESLVAQRKEANRHVDRWQPRYVGPLQKTVVFVIGESSNRWNWSLFGYSRPTTPLLEARRAELLVFGDVVSSYGNTIRSLTRALTFADIGDDNSWRSEPTVMMLAKAAGYKVFWLANSGQANMYFKSVFAGDVDAFDAIGATADGDFDENLLPSFLKALDDPAPLKLIVLHTMGSHDDYARRYPPAFKKFGAEDDQVSAQMASQWSWVRRARDDYDNSILYTDHFLTDLLDRLQIRKEPDISLLYVSDHGEEVGHLTSHSGHEFHMESGYVVPMLFWSKRPGFPTPEEKALESRSYQTDKLEWTLLPLLSISTLHDQPNYDLLGSSYKPWQRLIDGRPYTPLFSHVNGPIMGR